MLRAGCGVQKSHVLLSVAVVELQRSRGQTSASCRTCCVCGGGGGGGGDSTLFCGGVVV